MKAVTRKIKEAEAIKLEKQCKEITADNGKKKKTEIED